MAYGLRLQNAFGETITEYEHVIMEKLAQGVTHTPASIDGDKDAYLFNIWAYQYSYPQRPYYEMVATGGRYQTSGYYYDGSGFNRTYIGKDDWKLGDTPFVQPKTGGIWGMLGAPLRLPSNGAWTMQWAVGSYPDTGLNFKMGTITPPGSPQGTFGLRIKNATGEVVFDSRFPQISIADHFYVSQEQFEDILDNNATRNFTIRTPTPNAYISMPMWGAFRFTGSGGCYVPRIRQVSDTQFTVDRVVVPEIRPGIIPPGYSVPVAGAFYHDATVLVAKNL